MKIQNYFFLLLVAFTFASCGGGGGNFWEGEKPAEGDEVGKLAFQACECIYNTLEEKGIDADLMISDGPQMMEDMERMQAGEIDQMEFMSRNKAIIEMSMEVAKKGMSMNFMSGGMECMKDIEKSVDKSSISSEADLEDRLKKNCALMKIARM